MRDLRVEDRLAIQDLEARYDRYFDERKGEEWSRLFTVNGRARERGATPGGPLLWAEGREALATFCNNAPFTGVHFVNLPHLTFEGDTVVSRMHYQFVGRFDARTDISRSAGYYDIRYEKVDGEWFIADRVTTTYAVNDKMLLGYPVVGAFDEEPTQ